MRQTNNSDYTFKVANRAYFDSTVNLTGCVGDILTNELQVVDFTKVSLCFCFWFLVLCLDFFLFVFRFLAFLTARCLICLVFFFSFPLLVLVGFVDFLCLLFLLISLLFLELLMYFLLTLSLIL